MLLKFIVLTHYDSDYWLFCLLLVLKIPLEYGCMFAEHTEYSSKP